MIVNIQKKMIFTKGMFLNCTVNKVNPPEVDYTWYSCTRECNDERWKLETKSPFLRLDSLPEFEMTYRCTAQNAAGSASKEVKVYSIESKQPT